MSMKQCRILNTVNGRDLVFYFSDHGHSLRFSIKDGGGTHIDDHLRPSYLNKTCASHSLRVSPGAKKHCVDITEVSCFGPRRAERPSKEKPLAIGHFRLLVLVKSYFRRRERWRPYILALHKEHIEPYKSDQLDTGISGGEKRQCKFDSV
ncbi:hypothetical protein P5673_025306 [Acropora cervicornis]|uniref:Uncharacterized protein n=1 Tax=Acropora cervicornis TaxID=6130 RepID=A0AAD9Q216_ACRCE|nr:hypothetical protein P5673_025306 [Acropora cervicornis]